MTTDNKITPFTFLTEINKGSKGKDLLVDCNCVKQANQPESLDSKYTPFMVNRGLSYFPDTVFYAAEMSQYYSLPHKMQFDFLRCSIRPGKRFAKWDKKEKESENIKLIKEAYGYSTKKAYSVLDLLSDEDMSKLKQKLNKGGVGK
jgi:hypothetical protein